MSNSTARRGEPDIRSNSCALSDIADSLSDAVVTTDRDGRIVFWNRAAERFFGPAQEEVLGQPLSAFLPETSPAERIVLTDRLRRGERIDNLKVRRTAAGGQHQEFSMTAVPVLGPNGPAGTTYLLRARHHSPGVFADAVADMLWAADASGRGTYVSRRFEQFMGRGLDASERKSWISKIVHPEDAGQMSDSWFFALRTGQRFEAEARLRRFDGSYRWFVVRGVPVLGEDDRISEWIGSCTDIDDLKRSEQALRRSNEELKQFAYAAAHDMQEPLRNVATSIGMLQRQYADQLDASAAPWVEASVEGAQRLHAMVKDLLTFSTILDHQRQPYARTSLQKALSQVWEALAPEAVPLGATLVSDPLPDVAIEEGHANQLLLNLVGNALKYHHPDRQPVVSISAAPHELGWSITVSDNGIGFDPAYSSLIFRVFKRLHARAEYTGNGIGLAICERIVAHYGGRIWAESKLGDGAKFHFTLPGCPT